MKTKLFTLLLAIAASIGSMFASYTEVNGIWYDFDSSTKTASVTYRGASYSSNEYSGNVVIPKSVTYNSTTYSVTSIGRRAFRDCSSLTSVTIPYSVTSIGNEAFYHCSGLTSVTIPHSVTSIGDLAFYKCSGLTSVTIPNSVTSIGSSAFEYCRGLTSVTIPYSVTSIGSLAFGVVPNVVYSGRATGSPWGALSVNGYVDGYLVYSDESKTTLLACSTSAQGEITIPNSVTSIGDYAFWECTGLTTVTIPNSVTSIGRSAFYNCTGLTSVTIGNSVTSIGNSAFSGCSGLTSVTIPNSVTSIGDWAFYNCIGLTSVTIPNSVTSFGYRAFSDCTGLTSVTIPNSVTSIGENAFSGCTGLTSATIGNSVTSIGEYAFYNCTGLTSVTIRSNAIMNKAYKSDNNLKYIFGLQVTEYIIGDDVTSIGDHAFEDCTGLTSVTIPNSVTSIRDYAFSGCAGLTSVTIPNSVTSIGEYAFYNCTGLTSVTIGNSVTSIGDYAFHRCSGLTSVTIGNSVTSIGRWAFSGCSGLNIVNISDIAAWCKIDFSSDYSNPFYYAKHLYVNDVEVTDLAIPNSVTFIRDRAFYHCTGLTSVTIPNSVTSIGDYAFYYCTGLTSVTIEAETPPTLWSGAFSNTNNCPIYVPCSSIDVYKNRWSDYASRIYGHGTCESYTIVFKNWDGTVLQSTSVYKGQTPQYTGETPTRPYDEQYSYTFSGWSPQIVAATADATYTAQFRAEEFTCNDVQDTWLQTGGSGLGSMTTNNSNVWTYNSQYGACGKKQGGATGLLLTPTKDLRGMKSVTLSFSHTHKFATNYTNEMTLWVCDNYKGDVSSSTWKQLTISPYASNNDWTFVNVNINVPLDYVGKKTVFGFKYVSTASNYATWEIKNLQLVAECAGTTPPDTLGHADVTTVSEVTATPNEDNSVTLTWPAVNGAETYTIEIKKNGDLICTLVFNANGQLISMNFAAPARNGKGRNIPAAEQSANGWKYVITGLEGNASYTYSVTAKDTNGNVLLNQSVNFSTGSSQGIDDVQGDNAQCTKLLRNGQIFILRGDKTYSITGQEVK